jgi:hypothetical protein
MHQKMDYPPPNWLVPPIALRQALWPPKWKIAAKQYHLRHRHH